MNGEVDQHLQFLSISTTLRSRKSILKPIPIKILIRGCLSAPDHRDKKDSTKVIRAYLFLKGKNPETMSQHQLSQEKARLLFP